MLGQRKGGRLVTFEIVATVACVEVGRRCKLPCVLVGVALGAAVKLDFEQRVLALGYVTLSTL